MLFVLSAWAHPVPPDLWYPFDASNPAAEAGGGPSMSGGGCPAVSTGGQLAVDDHLDCAGTSPSREAGWSAALNHGDTFSVAAWFWIDDPADCGDSDKCTFAQHGHTDSNGRGFIFQSAGTKLLMWVHDGQGAETGVYTTNDYPLGRWVWFAATVNGQDVRVYMDGQLDGQGDVNLNAVAQTNTPLRMGWTFNRSYAHGGKLDEVSLWDRPLTATEIGDIYAWYVDGDGDGWAGDDDCNDADGTVHPGAVEACNGIDDDCDGTADSGNATWYADTDGDGFGDAGTVLQGCAQPTGYTSDASDCDDDDPSVHPGADELCDAVDHDCDGSLTQGATDAPTWYADTDDDGFGDLGDPRVACSQPAGFVADATDCDDAFPQVHPGGTELCDGLDNDCNGTVDDGTTNAPTWYRDADGDGAGDPNQGTAACAAPPDHVANGTDCNDANAGVNPGATEVCNGIDDDCSGAVDEGLTVARFPDSDADGYGANVVALQVCPGTPGFVTDNTDCNDGDGSIGPAGTWYYDQDGDGFGNAASAALACQQPADFVASDTDCDDASAARFPGNPEVCDGLDNDCDGAADEDATNAGSWYLDADGDGHGAQGGSAVQACSAPAGRVAAANDCDDGDAAVFPGAPEACNGVDSDCNGQIDDGVTDRFWYVDGDGDGYGTTLGPLASCAPATGEVAQGGDCDDGNAAVRPNAAEQCNGVDDDCDGATDEGAANSQLWYADADGDGVGSIQVSTTACAAPSGYVATTGDCDDGRAARFPGNPEICDGLDNDCNGLPDDGIPGLAPLWPDADGDGFGDMTLPSQSRCPIPGWVPNGSDCNDAFDTVFPPDGAEPGGAETCDLLDNDCDGLVDDADPDVTGTTPFYSDADGDGWGDPATADAACIPLSGSVADGTDCDDSDPAVSPGATEIPGNGTDEDCDGSDATPLPEETADTANPITDTDTDAGPTPPTADTGAPEPDDGPVGTRRTGCRCDGGAGGAPGLLGLVMLVARRRSGRAR